MTTIDQIIALINAANSSQNPLTSAQLQFSEPVVNVGGALNTKVAVTAIPGSGYFGSVIVNYNRINLSDLGTDLGLTSESQFDIDTIVSILNTTRNAFLVDVDVEPIPIPKLAVGDIETVVLTANPLSLSWIGSIDISLLFGLPSNVSLLHTLMNVTLPGNNYLTS